MEVKVDREVCELNEICTRIAPDVFRIDDKTDELEIVQPEPPSEMHDDVREAVRMCPKQAISFS